MKLYDAAFLVNYAYLPVAKADTNAKTALKVNILKGTGYIPLVGTITQVFHHIEILKECRSPSSEDKHIRFASIARIFLTLLPGALPILDLIGSIWLRIIIAKSD